MKIFFKKSKAQKWKEKYFELEQDLAISNKIRDEQYVTERNLKTLYENLEKAYLSKVSKEWPEAANLINYIENLEKEVAYWKNIALNFKKFHQ